MRLADNLIRRLPRKMWVQLAFVLVILVTVPLVALGWRLIRTSQAAVKTSVLDDHAQLAIRAASEVDQFLKKPRDILINLASILSVIHADAWRQETALVELALNEEMFDRVSSVGLDGWEKASSGIGIPLRDRSLEKSFQAATQGHFAMSDVYISDDHTPYVTMAVPIRRLGKVAGVVMAEVSLRGLWDIVDNIRIGRTGRAYVVSEKGVLLADEDKKKVLSNLNLSNHGSVKAALGGKTGSREGADESGKKWLEAFAPIQSFGWGLVVKQSSEEAYSFLRLMLHASWVLIFFSVGVAIFVSVVLARMLVQPIRLLAEKMNLVAHGNFDQSLPVERKDEIGTLMRAFNEMVFQLKKARESEKLAAIGKAAAAITHELKNSLVTASTFIGLLPERRTDRKFLDEFTQVVPQELEAWRGMLQDISDFSRKSSFEILPLDAHHLLTDFSRLVKQRLDQHGVRFLLDLEPSLPAVKGNSQKLKQVLMNLVINAVEAMPEGGQVRLRASALRNGSPPEVRICVEDTGKGIPTDKLEAVFEPFHTTKAQGLGLGLAISREIVELHRGKLEVQSDQGHGSIFTIRLPADDSAS